MFRFDILCIIMTVYSIEPSRFLIFHLDDNEMLLFDPQHSYKMLCIDEFVFFSRWRFSGSEHTKKYVEGSIDAFPRIQLGCQNSVFITMVIATVKLSM